MTSNPDILEVVKIMERIDDRSRWKILGMAEEVEKKYAVQIFREHPPKPAPVLTLIRGGKRAEA